MSTLGQVENMDLTLVKRRVIRDQKWTSEYVDEVIKEYKRFLLLCFKFPDSNNVPSPDVDEVWHAHILHTRDYARDCQKYLGFFLHHAPSYGADQMQQDAKDFSEMLIKYKEMFGEEATGVWERGFGGVKPMQQNVIAVEGGTCGSSCSGKQYKKVDGTCGTGCGSNCKGKQDENGTCGSGCGNQDKKIEIKGTCGSGGCGSGCSGNQDKLPKGTCGSGGCGSGCSGNQDKLPKGTCGSGGCGSGCSGNQDKLPKGTCGSGGCGSGCSGNQDKFPKGTCGSGCGSGCSGNKDELPNKKVGTCGSGGCGSGCGGKQGSEESWAECPV